MWRIGLLLVAIFQKSLAQNYSAFQWSFNDNSISTSLEGCEQLPILVQSRTDNTSSVGTPPYYMIAFNPGGVPTTSFIGSDPANLTWTVNQPAGSSLLLSVVDAKGYYGGQAPQLYTVTGNSSLTCLPVRAISTPNITISPNFTSPVTTCEPMGMKISGGKMPYGLTLAAPNSPVLTNVTLGPTDDVFTYIDRVDPGTQVMASVFDADGVWATSTQLFQTSGSKDTSCTGLVSSSGNSSSVNMHPSDSKSHSTVAVDIIIPLVVLAILSAIGFYFWRRRRTGRSNKPGAAILPEAWMGPSSAPDDMALKDNLSGTFKPAVLTRYQTGNPYQPIYTGESSEMVVQHRDGGAIPTHEIPPPYFDHGSELAGTYSNTNNNVARGALLS